MLYLLPMKPLLLVPFLLLGTTVYQVHAQAAPLEQKTSSAVSTVMDQAKGKAHSMTLNPNRYSKQGQQAAQQTADLFYSPAFKKRIQDEQNRLEKEICKNCLTSRKEKKLTTESEKSEQTDNLAIQGELYLFLSSSVPDETVHAYLAAISKDDWKSITPVMRGLINGMQEIKVGTDYFSQILKVDQRCRDTKELKKICPRFKVSIRVNPLLFVQYNITRVPALVYDNEKKTVIIQGDASLDYLLERIDQELQDKDPALTKLAKNIRGEQ